MKTDITSEDFPFGPWLRSEMKSRHLDIYDLSIETGISDRTLADYLRGARPPKMMQLQLICQSIGKRLIIEDDLP